MSNVMLEAMSLGKLCVASRIGGALDVIRHGENGFLFDPYAEDDLRRVVPVALGGSEAVRRAARETIERGYTASIERAAYLSDDALSSSS